MAEIKLAEECIYLETFNLHDDKSTREIFDVLKQKSTRGLSVKIILDRIGSFWLDSRSRVELERAGVEVVFFNRWFYRNHRKILIIDKKIGFIGGVNIDGENASWIDLHLKLTGGMLVRSLVHSFIRAYRLGGGQDQAFLTSKKWHFFKTSSALYKAKCWLIEHFPIRGRSVLKKYYKEKCALARRSIVFATPYFVPHQWLIDSLKKAAKRGVKIEVLIPSSTDISIVNPVHRAYARLLSGLIDFKFLSEMNHAKVLLVDDREGLIGSNNIDAQSFDFNLEASVGFQRKDMVGDLKKILDYWKSIAKPFSNSYPKPHWYDWFVGFFIKLLQPIL